MIKLVALFAAYRLLRPLVTIVIVATLAVLLLSASHHAAGQRSHTVGQLQHTARSLVRLVRHALQKAIGP